MARVKQAPRKTIKASKAATNGKATGKTKRPAKKLAAVADPPYVNRELSWLKFNLRVLAQAEDPNTPLLERLKFLSIFKSNLDEFFMVRVSGLREQMEAGVLERSADGLTVAEQIANIYESARLVRKRAGDLLEKQLKPALAKSGIRIIPYTDLDEKSRSEMNARFKKDVFPVCTPLILHPAQTFPFISNRSLNLAVELANGSELRLARVKVPTVLSRFLPLPTGQHHFLLLEDLIANNLAELFPGVKIKGTHLFRVLRDADVEIRELESEDLISSVHETLRKRRFGDPVLLEVAKDMPKRVRNLLMNLLDLGRGDVYSVKGMLGLEGLMELSWLELPDLRFHPFNSHLSEHLSTSKSIFEATASHDVFIHHPYDSFRSVEAFVRSAAEDPQVIGIKQTLYRVGEQSPIVESLLAAANSGKQVAAMVELKARFDEGNNLVWSKALERAGVHVTYGFPELKTHCKLCIIVRREPKGIRTYAHIGTGNYNPETARLYTDFGLFTSDPDITQDCLEVFNYLTGFSKQKEYRKLLVAPVNLREGILSKIGQEIRAHRKSGDGQIVLKVNSLVDDEIVDALYEASRAGIKIELLVRGVCSLRPGVPGMSDTIRVISIVGRFLEHSRIHYFGGGGKPEAYIGSADLMRRNLERRIEVMTPIKSPEMIRHLREDILEPYLRDTQMAWVMQPDGSYVRRTPSRNKEPFAAQLHFMERPAEHPQLGLL